MDVLYSYYLEFWVNKGINELFVLISWYVLSFLAVTIFMILVVLVLVLAERKILALFTIRKGPNRVGFWGCLQTVADAIKLLFKEDIVPSGADKFLFTLAPIIVFVPALTIWSLIPFTSRFCVWDSSVGVILFMAFLTFPVFGVLLAGYASNNKYSLIGAVRATIQTISYEIPLFLAALGIVVLADSFNVNKIILAQSASLGLLGWFFIPSFIGFGIAFIASLAQMNRTPFDLPEAESELVSGYNTEYSGMKFAMFFLAEYAITFIICVFISVLYLGGYLSPFGFYIVEKLNLDFVLTQFLIYVEQFFWLMLKTSILIFIVMWIRATLPRLRQDQLVEFAWKILIPLAMFNLFVVAVFKYYKIWGVSLNG